MVHRADLAFCIQGGDQNHQKKRFTEAQIAFALREVEGGTAVEEIIWKMGVSEATFYRWEKKYASLGDVRSPAA